MKIVDLFKPRWRVLLQQSTKREDIKLNTIRKVRFINSFKIIVIHNECNVTRGL